MSSEPLHPVPDSADIAWRELDGVLDDIAQPAKSEQSPPEFHAECLRRVVTGRRGRPNRLAARARGGTASRLVPAAK